MWYFAYFLSFGLSFSGQWRFWDDTPVLGTWVSILNYFFLLKIDQWNCAESNMIQFLTHSFKVIFSLGPYLIFYFMQLRYLLLFPALLYFCIDLYSDLSAIRYSPSNPPPPTTHNQIWIEMIIWCSIMLFVSDFWQYPEINKNPRCSLGGSLISVIILGIRFLIVIITKQPQHTIVVNKWKFTQDYTSCKILSNKDRVKNWK